MGSVLSSSVSADLPAWPEDTGGRWSLPEVAQLLLLSPEPAAPPRPLPSSMKQDITCHTVLRGLQKSHTSHQNRARHADKPAENAGGPATQQMQIRKVPFPVADEPYESLTWMLAKEAEAGVRTCTGGAGPRP